MNLLFLAHNWIGYGPHGGTEIHLKNITDTLNRYTDHRIYILFPDFRMSNGGAFNVFQLYDTRAEATKVLILNNPTVPVAFRNDELTDLIAGIINQYKIDIVHFFHLLYYPLNLPLVVKQAGVKVLVAFHDYFLICPQFNLLKENKFFCDFPNISVKTCDLCLRQTFGYGAGTQTIRRSLISVVLRYADAVHYTCEDQKARFLAAYPHLEEKLSLTMGVGLDRAPSPEIVSRKQRGMNQPLKIACIGNFSQNKGADNLLQIISYYQSQNIIDIQFNIYGNIPPSYEAVLRSMAYGPILRIHGPYTPDQLPELLREIDVALFASIWPETFVLTLSEIWSCGLIPVAPKIGAFSERITHGENGLLYDGNDSGSAIEILNNLIQDRAILDGLLDGVCKVSYPSLKDNMSEYLSLYQQMLDRQEEHLEELMRLSITPYPEHWYAYVPPPLVSAPTESLNLLFKAWRFYRREGWSRTLIKSIGFLKARLFRP